MIHEAWAHGKNKVFLNWRSSPGVSQLELSRIHLFFFLTLLSLGGIWVPLITTSVNFKHSHSPTRATVDTHTASWHDSLYPSNKNKEISSALPKATRHLIPYSCFKFALLFLTDHSPPLEAKKSLQGTIVFRLPWISIISHRWSWWFRSFFWLSVTSQWNYDLPLLCGLFIQSVLCSVMAGCQRRSGCGKCVKM